MKTLEENKAIIIIKENFMKKSKDYRVEIEFSVLTLKCFILN